MSSCSKAAPSSSAASLAKELTEGTCRALGCTPDAVQIILTDIKKENWAEAGKLFSDT